MTAGVLKQNPHTWTDKKNAYLTGHNMRIFRVSPFVKQQNKHLTLITVKLWNWNVSYLSAETVMTASVLKQNPHTWMDKKNAYLIGHNMQIFRVSPFVKQQNKHLTLITVKLWNWNVSYLSAWCFCVQCIKERWHDVCHYHANILPYTRHKGNTATIR